MDLEERLMVYKNGLCRKAREEKVQETIQAAKTAFWTAQQEEMLSYREFLWIQAKLVQKRWWLLQMLLLTILWSILQQGQEAFYVQRSMGAAASLFVILIIPELWKNRACQCMEIETAAYYSIRQIYAARMLLFGIVDISLITVFCVSASVTLRFALSGLLTQFLFPMAVTACICFAVLCSRHRLHEVLAVSLCVIWSAVWMLIILNEKIYTIIALPIWLGLFGGALILLGIGIYRTWKNCNQYCEVNFNGIKVE